MCIANMLVCIGNEYTIFSGCMANIMNAGSEYIELGHIVCILHIWNIGFRYIDDMWNAYSMCLSCADNILTFLTRIDCIQFY